MAARREKDGRITERSAFPGESRARARRIQGMLRSLDVTQAELAESFGVSTAYLSQVITGARHARQMRARVAAVLGVGVRELWGLSQYAPVAAARAARAPMLQELASGARLANGGDAAGDPDASPTPEERALIREITERHATTAAAQVNRVRAQEREQLAAAPAQAGGRGRRG